MYFNQVNRKSVIYILPAAVIFIFLTEVTKIDVAVITPFCILAVIVFGVIFGFSHVAMLRYRAKHPKYYDPHSKKAQRIRDRQIREEEENMKRFRDDDSIKRRRKQLEDEYMQRLKAESENKISKGEE